MGSSIPGLTGITSFIRTLLDDGNAADARATIEAVGGDGWLAAGETWTYASADAPTFTFTVAADVTTKYSPGQRIKLTQTTVKYFIITAVSAFSGGNTTITVYGGTDYTLANAAISANYYSPVKAPVGFPLDPAKWTVTFSDTSTVAAGGTTTSVWYNPSGHSISIPIGIWDLSYQAAIQNSNSANVNMQTSCTLSTTNNGETDKNLSCWDYLANVTTLASGRGIPVSRRRYLTLAAKTTYYFNIMSGSTTNTLQTRGDLTPTRITAVCAYL